MHNSDEYNLTCIIVYDAIWKFLTIDIYKLKSWLGIFWLNWIELKRNKGIAGHCQDGGLEDYVGQVVNNLLHPPHSRCDCPGTHFLILMWSSCVDSYFLCNWISYGISSCLCTVSSQRFCALCYSRRTCVTWHYVWKNYQDKSITAKIIWSYRYSVFAAVFLLPDLNWEIWRFLHDMHASGILFRRM